MSYALRLSIGLLFLASCRPSNKVGELVGIPEAKNLEETFWVLQELDGKGVSTPEGKDLYLEFKADKNVIGFAGCNRIGGSFTQNGKKITLLLASTKMACNTLMDTESAFLGAMTRVNEYAIKDNELSLKSSGQTLARFRAGVRTSY